MDFYENWFGFTTIRALFFGNIVIGVILLFCVFGNRIFHWFNGILAWFGEIYSAEGYI